MSLKGSLQTAALPEVLNFLSDTGKSGELHVSGAHGEGRLWFHEGRISGFRAARAEQAFEAIFELLRIEDGDFTFDTDADRPEDATGVEGDAGQVVPAIEAAEARLAEWQQIVQVVPSLDHRLALRAESPSETVSLEPDQWMMIVAVGAGRTVGQVIDDRDLQEFDGCRAVRTLVDAKLVEVHDPETPAVEDSTPGPALAAGLHIGSYEPEPVPSFEVANGHSYDDQDASGHDPFLIAQATVDSEAAPMVSAQAPEGDHYAALRAAVVEIGDDLVTGPSDPSAAPETDEHPPAASYHLDREAAPDGRAALQALLTEVTADAETAHDEPVDGLADRGPWTEHELSAMDSETGWQEEGAEASNVVPFAPLHTEAQPVATGETDAETEEPDEEAPTEEPINRGLLLKFLSSVRN